MFSELLPAFEEMIKSSVKLRFVILQFVLVGLSSVILKIGVLHVARIPSSTNSEGASFNVRAGKLIVAQVIKG